MTIIMLIIGIVVIVVIGAIIFIYKIVGKDSIKNIPLLEDVSDSMLLNYDKTFGDTSPYREQYQKYANMIIEHWLLLNAGYEHYNEVLAIDKQYNYMIRIYSSVKEMMINRFGENSFTYEHYYWPVRHLAEQVARNYIVCVNCCLINCFCDLNVLISQNRENLETIEQMGEEFISLEQKYAYYKMNQGNYQIEEVKNLIENLKYYYD